jgi:hypothetical protein
MIRHSILLLAFSVAVSGCSALPGPAPGPREELARELARQREAWMARGVDDYRFVIRHGCFCPPEISGPFSVTVVDGVPTTVTWEGQVVDPARVPRLPLTIEGVFDVAQRSLGASRIEVQFDPVWAFPADVSVDPSAEMVDEEFGIMIQLFEPG